MMFVFNVILWYFIVTAVETQLSGGSQEDLTLKYPFLVGLISNDTYDTQTVCTGTLITSYFILSSAHCTLNFNSGIRAYRRASVRVLEYRRTINVYTHPSYDNTYKYDLSLIKVEEPFSNFHDFVRLSRKLLKIDDELNCDVIGIGLPQSPMGYRVPVRVKYGPKACEIPKNNLGIMYVISYTWKVSLCVRTVGSSCNLPCDRGDVLLCKGNTQYGVLSYGYDTSSRAAAMNDCGDSTVQSRHLFVNKYIDWILKTVSNHTNDRDNGRGDLHSTTVASTSTTTLSSTKPLPKKPTTDTYVFFDPVNYPYLVYLQGRPGEPVCGGTLISSNHVLTSAYCTTRMSEIQVTSSNKQQSNASLVYVHPKFDFNTLTADISIVVLSEPFNVTRFAQLVDFYNYSDGNEPKSLTCAVMVKSQQTYRYVPVKVKYGPNACRKSNDFEIQKTVNRTWAEFICGTPKIHSDVGGPLICDGLQYGIASHSYRMMRKTRKGADQTRFLVVNTYREWVDDVLAVSESGILEKHLCWTTMVVLLTAVYHLRDCIQQ